MVYKFVVPAKHRRELLDAVVKGNISEFTLENAKEQAYYQCAMRGIRLTVDLMEKLEELMTDGEVTLSVLRAWDGILDAEAERMDCVREQARSGVFSRRSGHVEAACEFLMGHTKFVPRIALDGGHYVRYVVAWNADDKIGYMGDAFASECRLGVGPVLDYDSYLKVYRVKGTLATKKAYGEYLAYNAQWTEDEVRMLTKLANKAAKRSEKREKRIAPTVVRATQPVAKYNWFTDGEDWAPRSAQAQKTRASAGLARYRRDRTRYVRPTDVDAQWLPYHICRFTCVPFTRVKGGEANEIGFSNLTRSIERVCVGEEWVKIIIPKLYHPKDGSLEEAAKAKEARQAKVAAMSRYNDLVARGADRIALVENGCLVPIFEERSILQCDQCKRAVESNHWCGMKPTHCRTWTKRTRKVTNKPRGPTRATNANDRQRTYYRKIKEQAKASAQRIMYVPSLTEQPHRPRLCRAERRMWRNNKAVCVALKEAFTKKGKPFNLIWHRDFVETNCCSDIKVARQIVSSYLKGNPSVVIVPNANDVSKPDVLVKAVHVLTEAPQPVEEKSPRWEYVRDFGSKLDFRLDVPIVKLFNNRLTRHNAAILLLSTFAELFGCGANECHSAASRCVVLRDTIKVVADRLSHLGRLSDRENFSERLVKAWTRGDPTVLTKWISEGAPLQFQIDKSEVPVNVRRAKRSPSGQGANSPYVSYDCEAVLPADLDRWVRPSKSDVLGNDSFEPFYAMVLPRLIQGAERDGTVSANLTEPQPEAVVEEPTCVICLVGGDVQATECGHLYHVKCLTKWLETKNNCPMCRQFIIVSEDLREAIDRFAESREMPHSEVRVIRGLAGGILLCGSARQPNESTSCYADRLQLEFVEDIKRVPKMSPVSSGHEDGHLIRQADCSVRIKREGVYSYICVKTPKGIFTPKHCDNSNAKHDVCDYPQEGPDTVELKHGSSVECKGKQYIVQDRVIKVQLQKRTALRWCFKTNESILSGAPVYSQGYLAGFVSGKLGDLVYLCTVDDRSINLNGPKFEEYFEWTSTLSYKPLRRNSPRIDSASGAVIKASMASTPISVRWQMARAIYKLTIAKNQGRLRRQQAEKEAAKRNALLCAIGCWCCLTCVSSHVEDIYSGNNFMLALENYGRFFLHEPTPMDFMEHLISLNGDLSAAVLHLQGIEPCDSDLDFDYINQAQLCSCTTKRQVMLYKAPWVTVEAVGMKTTSFSHLLNCKSHAMCTKCLRNVVVSGKNTSGQILFNVNTVDQVLEVATWLAPQNVTINVSATAPVNQQTAGTRQSSKVKGKPKKNVPNKKPKASSTKSIQTPEQAKADLEKVIKKLDKVVLEAQSTRKLTNKAKKEVQSIPGASGNKRARSNKKSKNAQTKDNKQKQGSKTFWNSLLVVACWLLLITQAFAAVIPAPNTIKNDPYLTAIWNGASDDMFGSLKQACTTNPTGECLTDLVNKVIEKNMALIKEAKANKATIATLSEAYHFLEATEKALIGDGVLSQYPSLKEFVTDLDRRVRAARSLKTLDEYKKKESEVTAAKEEYKKLYESLDKIISRLSRATQMWQEVNARAADIAINRPWADEQASSDNTTTMTYEELEQTKSSYETKSADIKREIDTKGQQNQEIFSIVTWGESNSCQAASLDQVVFDQENLNRIHQHLRKSVRAIRNSALNTKWANLSKEEQFIALAMTASGICTSNLQQLLFNKAYKPTYLSDTSIFSYNGSTKVDPVNHLLKAAWAECPNGVGDHGFTSGRVLCLPPPKTTSHHFTYATQLLSDTMSKPFMTTTLMMVSSMFGGWRFGLLVGLTTELIRSVTADCGAGSFHMLTRNDTDLSSFTYRVSEGDCFYHNGELYEVLELSEFRHLQYERTLVDRVLPQCSFSEYGCRGGKGREVCDNKPQCHKDCKEGKWFDTCTYQSSFPGDHCVIANAPWIGGGDFVYGGVCLRFESSANMEVYRDAGDFEDITMEVRKINGGTHETWSLGDTLSHLKTQAELQLKSTIRPTAHTHYVVLESKLYAGVESSMVENLCYYTDKQHATNSLSERCINVEFTFNAIKGELEYKYHAVDDHAWLVSNFEQLKDDELTTNTIRNSGTLVAPVTSVVLKTTSKRDITENVCDVQRMPEIASDSSLINVNAATKVTIKLDRTKCRVAISSKTCDVVSGLWHYVSNNIATAYVKCYTTKTANLTVKALNKSFDLEAGVGLHVTMDRDMWKHTVQSMYSGAKLSTNSFFSNLKTKFSSFSNLVDTLESLANFSPKAIAVVGGLSLLSLLSLGTLHIVPAVVFGVLAAAAYGTSGVWALDGLQLNQESYLILAMETILCVYLTYRFDVVVRFAYDLAEKAGVCEEQAMYRRLELVFLAGAIAFFNNLFLWFCLGSLLGRSLTRVALSSRDEGNEMLETLLTNAVAQKLAPMLVREYKLKSPGPLSRVDWECVSRADNPVKVTIDEDRGVVFFGDEEDSDDNIWDLDDGWWHFAKRESGVESSSGVFNPSIGVRCAHIMPLAQNEESFGDIAYPVGEKVNIPAKILGLAKVHVDERTRITVTIRKLHNGTIVISKYKGLTSGHACVYFDTDGYPYVLPVGGEFTDKPYGFLSTPYEPCLTTDIDHLFDQDVRSPRTEMLEARVWQYEEWHALQSDLRQKLYISAQSNLMQLLSAVNDPTRNSDEESISSAESVKVADDLRTESRQWLSENINKLVNNDSPVELILKNMFDRSSPWLLGYPEFVEHWSQRSDSYEKDGYVEKTNELTKYRWHTKCAIGRKCDDCAISQPWMAGLYHDPKHEELRTGRPQRWKWPCEPQDYLPIHEFWYQYYHEDTTYANIESFIKKAIACFDMSGHVLAHSKLAGQLFNNLRHMLGGQFGVDPNHFNSEYISYESMPYVIINKAVYGLTIAIGKADVEEGPAYIVRMPKCHEHDLKTLAYFLRKLAVFAFNVTVEKPTDIVSAIEYLTLPSYQYGPTWMCVCSPLQEVQELTRTIIESTGIAQLESEAHSLRKPFARTPTRSSEISRKSIQAWANVSLADFSFTDTREVGKVKEVDIEEDTEMLPSLLSDESKTSIMTVETWGMKGSAFASGGSIRTSYHVTSGNPIRIALPANECGDFGVGYDTVMLNVLATDRDEMSDDCCYARNLLLDTPKENNIYLVASPITKQYSYLKCIKSKCSKPDRRGVLFNLFLPVIPNFEDHTYTYNENLNLPGLSGCCIVGPENEIVGVYGLRDQIAVKELGATKTFEGFGVYSAEKQQQKTKEEFFNKAAEEFIRAPADKKYHALYAPTGSGKTTYFTCILLKKLIEAGETSACIYVTQPRELAAHNCYKGIKRMVSSLLGANASQVCIKLQLAQRTRIATEDTTYGKGPLTIEISTAGKWLRSYPWSSAAKTVKNTYLLIDEAHTMLEANLDTGGVVAMSSSENFNHKVCYITATPVAELNYANALAKQHRIETPTKPITDIEVLSHAADEPVTGARFVIDSKLISGTIPYKTPDCWSISLDLVLNQRVLIFVPSKSDCIRMRDDTRARYKDMVKAEVLYAPMTFDDVTAMPEACVIYATAFASSSITIPNLAGVFDLGLDWSNYITLTSGSEGISYTSCIRLSTISHNEREQRRGRGGRDRASWYGTPPEWSQSTDQVLGSYWAAVYFNTVTKVRHWNDCDRWLNTGGSIAKEMLKYRFLNYDRIKGFISEHAMDTKDFSQFDMLQETWAERFDALKDVDGDVLYWYLTPCIPRIVLEVANNNEMRTAIFGTECPSDFAKHLEECYAIFDSFEEARRAANDILRISAVSYQVSSNPSSILEALIKSGNSAATVFASKLEYWYRDGILDQESYEQCKQMWADDQALSKRRVPVKMTGPPPANAFQKKESGHAKTSASVNAGKKAKNTGDFVPSMTIGRSDTKVSKKAVKHEHKCVKCSRFYTHEHPMTNPNHQQRANQCPYEDCEWHESAENKAAKNTEKMDSIVSVSAAILALSFIGGGAYGLSVEFANKNSSRTVTALATVDTVDLAAAMKRVTTLPSQPPSWVQMVVDYAVSILKRALKFCRDDLFKYLESVLGFFGQSFKDLWQRVNSTNDSAIIVHVESFLKAAAVMAAPIGGLSAGLAGLIGGIHGALSGVMCAELGNVMTGLLTSVLTMIVCSCAGYGGVVALASTSVIAWLISSLTTKPNVSSIDREPISRCRQGLTLMAGMATGVVAQCTIRPVIDAFLAGATYKVASSNYFVKALRESIVPQTTFGGGAGAGVMIAKHIYRLVSGRTRKLDVIALCLEAVNLTWAHKSNPLTVISAVAVGSALGVAKLMCNDTEWWKGMVVALNAKNEKILGWLQATNSAWKFDQDSDPIDLLINSGFTISALILNPLSIISVIVNAITDFFMERAGRQGVDAGEVGLCLREALFTWSGVSPVAGVVAAVVKGMSCFIDKSGIWAPLRTERTDSDSVVSSVFDWFKSVADRAAGYADTVLGWFISVWEWLTRLGCSLWKNAKSLITGAMFSGGAMSSVLGSIPDSVVSYCSANNMSRSDLEALTKKTLYKIRDDPIPNEGVSQITRLGRSIGRDLAVGAISEISNRMISKADIVGWVKNAIGHVDYSVITTLNHECSSTCGLADIDIVLNNGDIQLLQRSCNFDFNSVVCYWKNSLQLDNCEIVVEQNKLFLSLLSIFVDIGPSDYEKFITTLSADEDNTLKWIRSVGVYSPFNALFTRLISTGDIDIPSNIDPQGLKALLDSRLHDAPENQVSSSKLTMDYDRVRTNRYGVLASLICADKSECSGEVPVELPKEEFDNITGFWQLDSAQPIDHFKCDSNGLRLLCGCLGREIESSDRGITVDLKGDKQGSEACIKKLQLRLNTAYNVDCVEYHFELSAAGSVAKTRVNVVSYVHVYLVKDKRRTRGFALLTGVSSCIFPTFLTELLSLSAMSNGLTYERVQAIDNALLGAYQINCSARGVPRAQVLVDSIKKVVPAPVSTVYNQLGAVIKLVIKDVGQKFRDLRDHTNNNRYPHAAEQIDFSTAINDIQSITAGVPSYPVKTTNQEMPPYWNCRYVKANEVGQKNITPYPVLLSVVRRRSDGLHPVHWFKYGQSCEVFTIKNVREAKRMGHFISCYSGCDVYVKGLWSTASGGCDCSITFTDEGCEYLSCALDKAKKEKTNGLANKVKKLSASVMSWSNSDNGQLTPRDSSCCVEAVALSQTCEQMSPTTSVVAVMGLEKLDSNTVFGALTRWIDYLVSTSNKAAERQEVFHVHEESVTTYAPPVVPVKIYTASRHVDFKESKVALGTAKRTAERLLPGISELCDEEIDVIINDSPQVEAEVYQAFKDSRSERLLTACPTNHAPWLCGSTEVSKGAPSYWIKLSEGNSHLYKPTPIDYDQLRQQIRAVHKYLGSLSKGTYDMYGYYDRVELPMRKTPNGIYASRAALKMEQLYKSDPSFFERHESYLDPACGYGGFAQYLTWRLKDGKPRAYHFSSLLRVGNSTAAPALELMQEHNSNMRCIQSNPIGGSGDIRDPSNNKHLQDLIRTKNITMLLLDVSEVFEDPDKEVLWWNKKPQGKLAPLSTAVQKLVTALPAGSDLLCKMVWGSKNTAALVHELTKNFSSVRVRKLATSKVVSREYYLFCYQKRSQVASIKRARLLADSVSEVIRQDIIRARNIYATRGKYANKPMQFDWFTPSSGKVLYRLLEPGSDLPSGASLSVDYVSTFQCPFHQLGTHVTDCKFNCKFGQYDVEKKVEVVWPINWTRKIALMRQYVKTVNAGRRQIYFDMSVKNDMYEHITSIGSYKTKDKTGSIKHTVNDLISSFMRDVCGTTWRNSVFGHTQQDRTSVLAAIKKRLDKEAGQPDQLCLAKFAKAIDLLTSSYGNSLKGTLSYASKEQVLKMMNNQGSTGILDPGANLAQFIEIYPNWYEMCFEQRIRKWEKGEETGEYMSIRLKPEPKARKDVAPDGRLEYDPRTVTDEQLEAGTNLTPRFIQFSDALTRLAHMITFGPLLLAHNKCKLYMTSVSGLPPHIQGKVARALWDLHEGEENRLIKTGDNPELGLKIEPNDMFYQKTGLYESVGQEKMLKHGNLRRCKMSNTTRQAYCNVHHQLPGVTPTRVSGLRSFEVLEGDAPSTADVVYRWETRAQRAVAMAQCKADLLLYINGTTMDDEDIHDRDAAGGVLDFSSLDCTITAAERAIAARDWAGYYKDPRHAKAIETAARNLCSPICVDDNGNITVRVGQRGSGEILTSIENSKIVAANILCSISECFGVSLEELTTPVASLIVKVASDPDKRPMAEYYKHKFGAYSYTEPIKPGGSLQYKAHGEILNKDVKVFEIGSIPFLVDGDDVSIYTDIKRMRRLIKYLNSRNNFLTQMRKSIRSGNESGAEMITKFENLQFCSHSYTPTFVGIDANSFRCVANRNNRDCYSTLKVARLKNYRIEMMPTRTNVHCLNKLMMTLKTSTAKWNPSDTKPGGCLDITQSKLISYLLLYPHLRWVRFACCVMLAVTGEESARLNELARRYGETGHQLLTQKKNMTKVISSLYSLYGVTSLTDIGLREYDLDQQDLRAIRFNAGLIRRTSPLTRSSFLDAAFKWLASQTIHSYVPLTYDPHVYKQYTRFANLHDVVPVETNDNWLETYVRKVLVASRAAVATAIVR